MSFYKCNIYVSIKTIKTKYVSIFWKKNLYAYFQSTELALLAPKLHINWSIEYVLFCFWLFIDHNVLRISMFHVFQGPIPFFAENYSIVLTMSHEYTPINSSITYLMGFWAVSFCPVLMKLLMNTHKQGFLVDLDVYFT